MLGECAICDLRFANEVQGAGCRVQGAGNDFRSGEGKAQSIETIAKRSQLC